MRVLTIKNLQKSFGDDQVLKGLSLNIESGKIYALIGKNGAGKTTLIRSIVGIYRDYTGEIALHLDKSREVGLMLQEDLFPSAIKVGEMVRLHLSFYKLKKDIPELLDLVGLGELQGKYVADLSGGRNGGCRFC